MDRVLTRRARRDTDCRRGGRSNARERLEANGQGHPGDLARKDDGQDERKDKTAVERIQAFLEQTETALKDQDFQQAEALSSRAVLLRQDLGGEK